MAIHRQDNAESKDRTCSITSTTTIDLETAITKTGCGKFNWIIFLLCFPVASTSVFATGSMSYVLSAAAPDLDLSPTDKAWLQSASYGGMVVSGYLWGFLSDAFGRKKLMVIGFLGDFFLNIGSSIFLNLPVILIFKFLSGFMACGPYSIYMVYITEVFSLEHRYMLTQFMGVFTSVASIMQSGIAMWLIPLQPPDWIPFKTWQLFLMFGGLPSLICGLCCLFFYESPKFLVYKGKGEKALSVCRNIFTINTGKPQISFPVKKIQARSSHSESKKPFYSRIMNEVFNLFRPPFLVKSLTIYTIFIVLFASQNTLRLWMPEIFIHLQNSSITNVIGLCPLISGRDELKSSTNVVPEDSVYISMALIHLSCLICHLSFAMLLKCVKRKLILIVSVVVAGGCILSVPWLYADSVLLPIAIFLAVYEAAVYSFFGAIVQLFPTHLRAKSISLAMVLGRIAVFIGNFLLSNIMFTYCEEMFYILAGGSLCAVIFLILLSFTPHDDTKLIQ